MQKSLKKPVPNKEYENDQRKGKRRYRERLIQDEEADQEIADYISPSKEVINEYDNYEPGDRHPSY